MPTYTQANRPLAITTPLGPDALLLAGLEGVEALSQPFAFRLDLLAQQPVSFDDLLGRPAGVRLSVPGAPERAVHGVLDELTQGGWVPGATGGTTFLRYQATLVPRLTLLGLRTQSRIWQTVSVPDVLRQVLHDGWQLDVQWELQGHYPPRDYCVQYQETDLAFVSRLMEDEGIWYFFRHDDGKDTVVVGDGPQGHPELAGMSELIYDAATGGQRPQTRVSGWQKTQRLRPSRTSLRDYHFEKPDSTLDASSHAHAPAAVGQASHRLDHQKTVGGQPLFQTDEYPGGFAWRFDGISPGGGDRPEQVPQLFEENRRVAGLRLQQELATALRVDGASDCGHLLPGCRFTLTRHFDADGPYVLTRVEHKADVSDAYLASESRQTDGGFGGDAERHAEFLYENRFEAIPLSVPFRPRRQTPRPRVAGAQTATVVGPAGQEIFVDRYGRVKVKFHWDRRDGGGPESSCWLRVAQVWAGRRWGAFFWPRIGHEVVVAFLEGDPERPLVVGSVYNDRNMPPFELPGDRVKGGIKSFSSSGSPDRACDPLQNFNGIVFHDAAGAEHVEIHSEHDVWLDSEHDHTHNVNGRHQLNVARYHGQQVGTVPRIAGGSSPSGGGGSSPAAGQSPSFSFAAHTDLDKAFGVNMTSVCGLNQTTTLGVRGNLQVGDLVNVTVNPIGMLADAIQLIPTAGATTGVVQGATGMFGAPFGGTLNVVFGHGTNLTYGTSMAVTRGARASVTSATNFHDAGINAGEKALIVAATAAAAAATVLLGVGVFEANRESYQADDKTWEGLLGTGGALVVLLTELETLRAGYQQMVKGEEAMAAAAAGRNAKAFAANADNLVTIVTNDRVNLNDLKWTSGNVGEYSASRITGGKEMLLLFAGSVVDEQSVVSLQNDGIALVSGNPLTGPTVLLDRVVGKVGLEVTPDSTLEVTATAITLKVGPYGLTISAEAGITLSGPSGTVSLTDYGLQVETANAGFELEGEFAVKAADLLEIISGEVTRTGGMWSLE